MYEQILSDLHSAGNAGEFYTPRPLTELMVDRVNPQLKDREVVLDPACGTGGCLTATISHLEGQVNKKSGATDRKALAECIRGFERKQLPYLLCVTNMLLHGIEVPSMIERRNTLGHPWNGWTKDDKASCIITNPPFGGLEDEKVGADYLIKTRETADMFMSLIVKKLLRDNGRAAVVLPDGFLFGEGTKNLIKRDLLKRLQPSHDRATPKRRLQSLHGHQNKSAVLHEGTADRNDLVCRHRYPKGQKSYSKTKPLRIAEFDTLKAWWGNESDGFKDRVVTDRALGHFHSSKRRTKLKPRRSRIGTKPSSSGTKPMP